MFVKHPVTLATCYQGYCSFEVSSDHRYLFPLYKTWCNYGSGFLKFDTLVYAKIDVLRMCILYW